MNLPATDLEMYPGTTATKAAAARPAPELESSLVSKYVMMVVSDEKRGARNTQTLRISIERWKKLRTWYKAADVTIKPEKGNQV